MKFGRIALLLLVLAFAGYLATKINIIPMQDEQVKAAWAQVENQYQRRLDLVPNIVETVKGVANFEQETLTAVTEARAKATQTTLSAQALNDPEAVKRFEQAQGGLGSAMARLMVASERYPELKANSNFTDLQAQLEGTENRIAVARKDYIDTVQAYNIIVRTFPGIIWAKIYGAEAKVPFTAAEGAEKAPPVKFQ